MRMIDKIFGGRPMRFQERAFIDAVTGKSVNIYIDRLGRRFMDENRWSFSEFLWRNNAT